MTPEQLTTLAHWVTFTKDIVTCFAAGIAAYVAFVGFRTWEQQLVWKTKYELAQRMSRAVYKVRNALSEARRFQITEGENSKAVKDAGGEVSSDPYIRSLKAVYAKRREK